MGQLVMNVLPADEELEGLREGAEVYIIKMSKECGPGVDDGESEETWGEKMMHPEGADGLSPHDRAVENLSTGRYHRPAH